MFELGFAAPAVIVALREGVVAPGELAARFQDLDVDARRVRALVLDLSSLRVFGTDHVQVIRDRIAPRIAGLERLAVVVALPVLGLFGSVLEGWAPVRPETRWFSDVHWRSSDGVTAWLERREPAQPVAIATLIDAASHYFRQGERDAARACLPVVAAELADRRLEPAERGELELRYAEALRHTGDPAVATVLLTKLVNRFAAGEPLAGILRSAAAQLGYCLTDQQRFSEAVPAFLLALESPGRPGEEPGRAERLLEAAIGRSFLNMRQASRALPHLEAATRNAPDAATLHNLALCFEMLKRPEDAARVFQRAFEMRAQELGPEHPLAIENLEGLARVGQGRV